MKKWLFTGLLALATAIVVAPIVSPAFAEQDEPVCSQGGTPSCDNEGANPPAPNPAAVEEEVDAMLRRMLEASQRALAEYERHHGLKPLVLPPIVVPPVHIYRPTDYSRPQPPVGNYDAFNTPGVFGSSRPSCMPYYPGCSDAR